MKYLLVLLTTIMVLFCGCERENFKSGYIVSVSYYNDLYPESPNTETAYIESDNLNNFKLYKSNRGNEDLNILNNITLNDGYWFPKDGNSNYIHSCFEKGEFIYNYKPKDFSLKYTKYEEKDYEDSLRIDNANQFIYTDKHSHYSILVWNVKSKFCICNNYPAMPRQYMGNQKAIVFKEFKLNTNIEKNEKDKLDLIFKKILFQVR